MTINKTLLKTKPFDHQLKILEESWDKKSWALLLEMGTGKSKLFIDTAVQLYDAGLIDTVLLLAPKGVDRVWLHEQLPSHFPDSIPLLASHWENPASKEVQGQWAAFKTWHHGLKWMVMNIEALSYDSGHKFASNFINAFGKKMLMGIDESTMIKGHTAIRTKRVIKLGEKAAYKRILTGQIAPQGATDVYSQIQFLGNNLLGFSSFFAFRARYCVLSLQYGHGGRSFQTVTGYQRLDELHNKISRFSSRVKKEDCLDLPPKIYQTWHVEMPPQQLKMYKQMKDDAIAIIAQDLSSAPLAITQLVRLQQILCGFIRTDDGAIHNFPNYRITALKEIINLTDDKIIIWASFRHSIEAIKQALVEEYGEESVVTYFGDTTSNERIENITALQSGSARFFVGNPASGRFGLTLTSSSTVIYFNNSYNLEHRTQSEDRVHRIGQTASSVNYIDLVVPNTIDTKVLEILKLKEENAAAINGEVLMKWLKEK